METSTSTHSLAPKLSTGQINVRSYPFNREDNYLLDGKTPWVKELLSELESDLMMDGTKNPDGIIEVELNIQKKTSSTLRDHIIILGKIRAKYYGSCVRCLELTHESIEGDFSCCFIDSELAKESQFEDSEYVNFGTNELELYAFEKGRLDLKELIHENLYVAANPLPLHDENCKGLCPSCGINLNVDSCDHNHLKN